MPPQSISSTCRLFQAENSESPKDSARNFHLSPDRPKNKKKEFRHRACSENITRDICKEYGLCAVDENSRQSLEITVHSVFHCHCMAQQIFTQQTFAFPSSCQLLSSSLKKETTAFNILFCL